MGVDKRCVNFGYNIKGEKKKVLNKRRNKNDVGSILDKVLL